MPYADPEFARAYHREWKRQNRWRYREQTKFYDAAKHANERAAKYQVDGTLTPDDVRAVLLGAVCYYCGTPDRMGIDHRVAMALGGPNVPANLVPCCVPCNSSKMNTDRPGRWAWKHDCCVQCGGSDKKHVSRGLCSPCYWQWYEAAHPGRRSKKK